jgi:ABC-2 type transport system ATP-binding protein
MIVVEHLVFDYPGLRALDDVSVTIPAGAVTALVGPNGAGKTTLMRCIAALDQPFSGRVTVDGIDVHAEPRLAHARMGFLPDFYGLYDELTVAQCLAYRAGAQGVPAADRPRLVELVAARLAIADRLDQKAGTLSRGLRQRLAIAQAIIHEPKVVLLDEPASGLDPEARHGLAAVLRQLRAEGMTLIVSSHILAELADYSTEMLMIDKGRVVEHGAVGRAADGDGRVPMLLTLAAPDDRLGDVLGAIAGVSAAAVDGATARFLLAGDAAARHLVLKALIAADLPVAGFAVAETSLQDTYLARMRGAGSENGGGA